MFKPKTITPTDKIQTILVSMLDGCEAAGMCHDHVSKIHHSMMECFERLHDGAYKALCNLIKEILDYPEPEDCPEELAGK